ncbi:MAG: acetate--CoA ligase family protein [Granulosicoccus sp.]
MSERFTRLLNPESIVVVGGNWAVPVVEQCRALGYAGPIWPVHPTRDTLAGEPCFPALSELPAAPDAAFIAVNNDLTINAVAQLSKLGAGGAICFASGFSENARLDEQAEVRQDKLVSAAGNMPIIGPNGYGMINYLDKVALWPDQHGGKPVEAGVAVITQSSNIAINLTMQRRGLPVAFLVTVGNQAQTSLAEVASTILKDSRVTALGLHIEGFSDIPAFEALSKVARSLGKHIVVLKTGITPLSRAAVLSHTRSLSGNDVAASAFIERLNMIRVQGLGEFIETLKVLNGPRQVAGYRVLSMSCSGGEAAIVGDVASDVGLQFPALHKRQKIALRNVLGKQLRLSNPLDYHTQIWNDIPAMQAMVRGMLQTSDASASPSETADGSGEQFADVAVLVLDFPRQDRCSIASWQIAMDTYVEVARDWHGCAVVLSTMPENMPESIAEELLRRGVVALCGLRDGLLALRNAAWLASASRTELAQPVWLADSNSAAIKNAVQTVFDHEENLPREGTSALHASKIVWNLADNASSVGGVRQLDESTAKRWLTRFGVQVPVNFRLSFADVRSSRRLGKALDKASRSFAYPVVVKGLGLAQKSEANGIALNISNRRELESAIKELNCVGGCLVEEYVDGTVVELLVSVLHDPVHGLLMTLGAGGVTTELLRDTAHCLVPCSREELDRRLMSLRCAALLNGFRGREAVNRDCLLDTLLAVQQAALQLGDRLVELEINPLLCTAEACVAADALVAVRD